MQVKKTMGTKARLMGLAMMSLVGLVSLGACAAGHGSFRYDDQVDRQFKTLTVLPGHRYYYSGPVSRPRAIIAIDAAYTLASDFWKPVEMTPEVLKNWVQSPTRKAYYDVATYGRVILDDKGQRVGVWYSLKDRLDFATVRMVDATTVNVSTPFETPRKRIGPWMFDDN